MKKYTTHSSDSTPLVYEVSGQGDTALLFIHGWLGNKSWWEGQREVFEKDYLVARMDLAGHGESGKERKTYTTKLYADDIAAVANNLEAKNIILVGHSMSGAYVLEAASKISHLKALVVIDTLKDLDFTYTSEQVETFLELYRSNFKMAVESILPQYLFVPTTPPAVKARLEQEFLSQSDFAMAAIEPLYRMDLKASAQKVKVPVRAINADNSPTNADANKKYLKDYDFKMIHGTGHYPMLEKVKEFNEILKEIVKDPHARVN